MANPVENMSPQTEVVTATLDQVAINKLLDHAQDQTWRGTTLNTSAQPTGTEQGLQLNTIENLSGPANTMIVTGDRTVAPADAPRTSIKGDVTLAGGPLGITGGHYERSYPTLPGWFGTSYDEYRTALQLKGSNGQPGVTLEPGTYTFARKADGTIKYDANNQPVRITAATTGDNSHADNPLNPNNHRVESTYVMHIPGRGDFSLITTSEKLGSGYVSERSVLRTLSGDVLGILSSDLQLNVQGDPYHITTSIRRPE